jgi:hypothetical protein
MIGWEQRCAGLKTVSRKGLWVRVPRPQKPGLRSEGRAGTDRDEFLSPDRKLWKSLLPLTFPYPVCTVDLAKSAT